MILNFSLTLDFQMCLTGLTRENSRVTFFDRNDLKTFHEWLMIKLWIKSDSFGLLFEHFQTLPTSLLIELRLFSNFPCSDDRSGDFELVWNEKSLLESTALLKKLSRFQEATNRADRASFLDQLAIRGWFSFAVLFLHSPHSTLLTICSHKIQTPEESSLIACRFVRYPWLWYAPI